MIAVKDAKGAQKWHFGNQTVNRYVISKTWWFNEVESVPNKQIYKHADTTRPRKLC